ncbi:uncharacterized protein LOC124543147 isoform X2 [Vanessa cardui]|uniref:uncharacterized protein LOC124543147 isoform X2 n=1 Tax=Vanessa cardui TaxID=171605 RepID=UPI001F139D1B|nr:uncharacterized protein LOC124543147 isoform X2 [Vanessa cardui]
MMKKRNIVARFGDLNRCFLEFAPFASSPPAPEDSFFYIRYPKTDALLGKPKFSNDIPKVMIEQHNEVAATATFSVVKDKDWSKHTKPCQEVLHGIAPINTAVKSVNAKPKPAGTDDGFKGEGAACGSSVVKVAHQMIQTRSPRGFTVATPADDAAEPSPRLLARRGSKSLPATPAHSPPASPSARRRVHANRFFTSAFEASEEGGGRSWLASALLGYKKDLAGSSSTLPEEEPADHRLQSGSLAESVESLGPSPKVDPKVISNETSQQPKLTKPAHSFRPKPSELREMNFWSPTSM